MKTKRVLFSTFVLVVFLAACGSSGSGSGGSSSTSANTREVTGTLTGDLSHITGAEAVRVSDGVKFPATLAPSAAKMNALVAGAAGATLTANLPVNGTYTLNLLGESNSAAATLQFPANVAGTATTANFTVSANPAPGGATTTINLGAVPVPAGTGAAGATHSVDITPEHNPLAQDDEDADGVADLEDSKYHVAHPETGGNSTSGSSGTETSSGPDSSSPDHDGSTDPSGSGSNHGNTGTGTTGGSHT